MKRLFVFLLDAVLNRGHASAGNAEAIESKSLVNLPAAAAD